MDKDLKTTIVCTEDSVKITEIEGGVSRKVLQAKEEKIQLLKERAKRFYPQNIPFSAFSEKQKSAQMIIIEETLRRENGEVLIIPAPPGSGKSIVIPVIMALMAADKSGSVPMLTITDKLARLEEYKTADAFDLVKKWMICGRELRHVDLRKKTMDLSEPGQDVLVSMSQMKYKSNLMMTTQKFACMSEQSKESIMEFLCNGTKDTRKLLIVDEAPEIYSTGVISLKTVEDIGATLQEVAEGEEDQQFIYDLFRSLHERMYGLFMQLDQCSSQTTITLPVTFEGQELWESERRVEEIVKDKLDQIYEIDLGFREKYRSFKSFLKSGGIYVSQKTDEGKKNPNRRRILVPLDFGDDFVFHGCKTIILDGTADADWRYSGKKSFRMLDMNKFRRDFSNLGIRFHDMTTSKTYFYDHKEIQDRIIEECLKCSVARNGKDILVVTYKEIEDQVRKTAKKMGIRKENIAHWGAVTGSNHWRDLKGMCIIGLNRKKTIDYLIDACAVNPVLWNQLFQFDFNNAEEREAMIEELNRMSANHGSEKFTEIVEAKEEVFVRSTLVELEQAIYRTKLRNYSCSEAINVDIFCRVTGPGSYTGLVKLVKTRFPEADVKVFNKPLGVQALLNDSKTPRAGTDGTAIQKTKWYLQTMEPGKFFTKRDIASSTGISYSMVTHKVCNNPEIQAILQEWKVGGWYRKPILGEPS